jgi:16S rRNA (guanine527-N7)-methyltransferase
MLTLFEKLLSATTLQLTPEQKKAQLHYLALLNQWNKAYNLTAVRQPEQMLTRHIMDSLAIAPFLQGEQLLDVGSGAGLPGIPLAIAQPERHFTLLDSAGKRIRFLIHVQQQLGLNNVTVLQSRVELFSPTKPFDGIISRAFASLSTMLTQSHQLLCPNGQFYAMKGKLSAEELAGISNNFSITELIPLQVPGLPNEERHLIVIRRG